MMSDDELLAEYSGRGPGAQDAFAELVRRHLDLVYASALRQTRNPERAKDVVQNVFIALARKAPALAGRKDLLGWLFLAGRFASVDLLRREARRQARESVHCLETMTGAGPPEIDRAEWERLAPVLDEALAGLKDSDRAVILLRFFQGKSFAEIGAAVASSENTVRMRMERALGKLRRQLARRGVESTAAALAMALTGQPAVAAPAGLQAAAVALSQSVLAGSAYGAGAAVGGAFQFMTTTKLTLGVAALVTVLSVASALHEHAAADQARAAAAVAQGEMRRALGASARSDTSGSTLLGNHGGSGGLALTNAGAPGGSARHDASSGAASGGGSATPMSAILKLMSDPAMQRQTAAAAAMRLDAQYGPFFKAMHLTTEQVAHLKQLLVEKQMVGFDSMAAAEDQGLTATRDPRAFFEAVAGAERTVDTQIGSLLGSDGLQQFQSYFQSVPARTTVNQLTQSLSYSAEPMSDTQRDRVIEILTREGAPALPPGNPFAPLNGDLGIVKLSDTGMAQLQGLLSPGQMQAFNATVRGHQELLAARQNMGRPR